MKTIVFAGGGTAGHVMPNIALYEQLKTKYNCVYVGGDGMEKDICRQRGIPFYRINTVKFRRDALLKNLGVPFKLHACIKSAKAALNEIKPDIVFSKGGYAALPVVLAAKCTVLSHESDYSPGLATKIAKRHSAKVLCAFEPCAQKFKNGLYVGTPLMQNLYSGVRAPRDYGLSGARPILTVIGGSSGAASLNGIIIDSLPDILKRYDVIHMTGKNKHGGQKRAGYCPIEFESNMAKLYATSDLIITRAGANALAECIALKIPTVAVPLEKASRGDQVQNAEYYGGFGAVKVMHEKDMTTRSVIDGLAELSINKQKYVSAMSKLSVDGTKRIVEIIEELISN